MQGRTFRWERRALALRISFLEGVGFSPGDDPALSQIPRYRKHRRYRKPRVHPTRMHSRPAELTCSHRPPIAHRREPHSERQQQHKQRIQTHRLHAPPMHQRHQRPRRPTSRTLNPKPQMNRTRRKISRRPHRQRRAYQHPSPQRRIRYTPAPPPRRIRNQIATPLYRTIRFSSLIRFRWYWK